MIADAMNDHGADAVGMSEKQSWSARMMPSFNALRLAGRLRAHGQHRARGLDLEQSCPVGESQRFPWAYCVLPRIVMFYNYLTASQ